MNASSVRDREREELQKLAKLAADSKAPRALPAATLSADSSGYVDLSALNLGSRNWIDEALRRTPPAVPARSSAPSPQRAPRDSFPSDPRSSIVPHALDSVDLLLPLGPVDDGYDGAGITAQTVMAGRPRRLAPFVATVFALCVVLCGFAARRVVSTRAAEAEAARAMLSAGPSIPAVMPNIPPPPPVSEAPQAPVVAGAAVAPPEAAAATELSALASPAKRAARPAAPKKKRAPEVASPAATHAKAKTAPAAKSLDDAIEQTFAPSSKTPK